MSEQITQTEVRAKRFDCGIDILRGAVAAFACCNETFLWRFSPEQLLRLYDAWMASDWDVSPDQWTEAQVQQALVGWVPAWTAHEEPTRPTKRILRGTR